MSDALNLPDWARGRVSVERVPSNTRDLLQLAEELSTRLTARVAEYDRWQVNLYGVEVKEGAGLTSEYGTGQTFDDAATDYAKKISGKRLVFNAMLKDERKEVGPYRVILPPA